MGYYGKIEEKNRAQSLRKQGYSYNEILQHIHVSKDTISRWCKDIVLNDKQKERLINNKLFGQKKGSIIAAENKRKIKENLIKTIFAKSLKTVNRLNRRDKFITGIALYAAEGTKADGNIVFANSDPRLIKFMVSWFREFCKIPPTKFRGSIWLHEGLNESNAKTYWSNLTGIPVSSFHKTYIAINKTNSKKIRKNIHENGIFAVKASDSNKHRQIMGWILALIGDKIPVTAT